jgi:hypothetical protein
VDPKPDARRVERTITAIAPRTGPLFRSSGIRQAPARAGRHAPSSAQYWGVRFVAGAAIAWAAGVAIGFDLALTIVSLSALAAIVVGIRRPILGLFGVTAMCTVDFMTSNRVFTGGLLRFNTFNYCLLGALAIFWGPISRLRNSHAVLLTGLIGFMALQLYGTPDLDFGIQQLIELAIFFSLVAYFGRAAAQEPHVWFWVGMVSSVVSAGAGAIYYLQKLDVNHNGWALCPLTGMFAICLAIHDSRGSFRGQMTLVGLAGINMVWLILSASRGGMITGTVCLLFVFLELRSFKRQAGFAVIGLILAASMGSLFGDLQEQSFERFGLLFNDGESARARTSGRYDLAAGAWRMFREHPFGIGTGAFPTAWKNVNSIEGQREFYATDKKVSAHAGWMRILAENGVVGFALLAAYLGSFAFEGWRRRDDGVLPIGLLVTIALGVAFTSFNLEGKGIWLLTSGATVLLHRRSLTTLFAASGALATSGSAPRTRRFFVARPVG